MSRLTSKQQFVDETVKGRTKLEGLRDQIPAQDKLIEVTDGMSVKDFLAHRTEWGRMMIRWLHEARAGKTPAVPFERYKWNQPKELNAEIHDRFEAMPLDQVEREFRSVHDRLLLPVQSTSENELFTKQY